MTVSVVVPNVRAIIVAKGFQKQCVAEKMGLTSQQFSSILNGRKRLLADHLPALADALGVSIQDLYDWEERTK